MMMTSVDALQVYLQDYWVGDLIKLPGDRILFNFKESYLNDPSRPTLSQSFFDKLRQPIQNVAPTQTRAPSYFSNLLPEGHMRDYLASKAKVSLVKDFELLRLLGHDLPGAIELKPMSITLAEVLQQNKLRQEEEEGEQVLKFSLAGVQLKFSAVLEANGGLTIPAHGVGGDWIVKLPSQRFQHVPENEFVMLNLAKSIGIDVPKTQLVPVSAIKNLPQITANTDQHALIIQRFDRSRTGKIHTEDLAQVYNVYPQKKYQLVSYNNIANMIATVVGYAGLYEFVKRLMFNLLIGNADMHLKNWSLIYPDSRQAQLSPAYDYVATQVFIPDGKLALSLAGEKKMHEINRQTWARFSKKITVPEHKILDIVDETIALTQQAWRSARADALQDRATTQAISDHMALVAKNHS